jgi:Histidine kinase-like ATPase domain
MPAAGHDHAAAEPTITWWDGRSEHSLARALLPPASNCVEAGVIGRAASHGVRSGAAPARRAPSNRRLDLMVTARSVYRFAVARIFADALQVRLGLAPELRERVHTALQEATMNALIHGNLALDGGQRDDLRALMASGAIIEALFASPEIALSMIRLRASWTTTMLDVVVRDSGSGFRNGQSPAPDEAMATRRLGPGGRAPEGHMPEGGMPEGGMPEGGMPEGGMPEGGPPEGGIPAGHTIRDRATGRGLAIMQASCDRVVFLQGGTAVRLGFVLPRRLRDV